MPRFASTDTHLARREDRPAGDDPLREPVLRPVDDAVDARAATRSAAPPVSGSADAARESRAALKLRLSTDVSATKPTSPGAGHSRVTADRGEQRGVDDEVDLGVEIAAEGGRSARQARELAVGVVEERLQLDEQRREQERAARELDRARDARGSGGDDDSGRRHAQPREDEHERVRERPEHRFAHELVAVPPLPRAGERAQTAKVPSPERISSRASSTLSQTFQSSTPRGLPSSTYVTTPLRFGSCQSSTVSSRESTCADGFVAEVEEVGVEERKVVVRLRGAGHVRADDLAVRVRVILVLDAHRRCRAPRRGSARRHRRRRRRRVRSHGRTRRRRSRRPPRARLPLRDAVFGDRRRARRRRRRPRATRPSPRVTLVPTRR